MSNISQKQGFWLAVGAVLGLVASLYWPQDRAQAGYAAADGAKFTMCTCSSLEGTPDAMFILDQTTGRLQGVIPNRQGGGLGAQFARSLAQDFQITSGAEYIMIPSEIRPTQTSEYPPGNGGVWVAEVKTGLAILYLYPIAAGGAELSKYAQFQWRKPTR